MFNNLASKKDKLSENSPEKSNIHYTEDEFSLFLRQNSEEKNKDEGNLTRQSINKLFQAENHNK